MQNFQWVGWIIQGVIALITLVAAIAAWRAANAAKQSAAESHRTAVSQVIAQVTNNYASNEMLHGMMRLRSWKDKYGDNFASEFYSKLNNKEEEAIILNEDRRRFSHHMNQIRLLFKRGVLEEDDVRELATCGKFSQVGFLLEVVKPLEEVINPDCDHSLFEFFDNLCKNSKSDINSS
ncbi:MAG: hypothetical protein ISS58_03365 [Dehalococcoidales bacterium]|nr:hypothetical protein [Dehalococcoidales bacterium]